MARYSKAQLLTLRSNIDQYLKKQEESEDITYKKLSEAFSTSKATLNQILQRIENGVGYEKFATALKSLKNDMGEAINATKPDMSGVTLALKDFQQSVTNILSEQRKTDQNIIQYLTALSKSLSEKPKQTKDRTDEVIEALKKIKVNIPEIEFPRSVEVSNFPPQRVANPVTHISINSLRGFVKTTSATVTSTLTTLPSYGVLDDRRSIIVYNNSSNTIYIGGSDVTDNNGMPVPTSSFSPILDCGKDMILYGIATTGSNNVRIMEVSDEASGR